MHLRMCVCVCVYMCACLHVRMYVWEYVCAEALVIDKPVARSNEHASVCVCVCVYVCVVNAHFVRQLCR